MSVLCFDAASSKDIDRLVLDLLTHMKSRIHSGYQPPVEDVRQMAVGAEWLFAKNQITSDELKQLQTSAENHITSSLHLSVATQLQLSLKAKSKSYRVENEFSGLTTGVFPVDSVVYFDDKIVAFVEFDGKQHYTADGRELMRVDKLKEHLYSVAYPDVPVIRVKNTDADKMGLDETGKMLSDEISCWLQ